MALEDYAGLKSAITTWTARADLAPQADDFIDLCEAEINRTMRGMKQITTVTLTPDANSRVTLPADYIQFRNVATLTPQRISLDAMPPGGMDDANPLRTAGGPPMFSVDGSTILIMPPTVDNIELEYFAKIPGLSATNTTNWLLAKAPNVYLYGCLKYAFLFTRNSQGVEAYALLFTKAMDEVLQEERTAIWSRARARVQGATP